MAQVAQPQSSFGFSSKDSKNQSESTALPVKLVIYDFDQTITVEHLYNVLKNDQDKRLKEMTDERLQKVFGGTERIQRLKEHFNRVSTKCELAIISFGWSTVIISSLKRMGLFDHFAESIIIGRDSEEIKSASAEKKECICRMKKDRKLKSDQIIFVDDSNQNIAKSQSYCIAMLVEPAEGMSNEMMKEIEEKCDVYPSTVEVTTPRSVADQTSKHYPRNSAEQKESDSNPLSKYQIKEVPSWFEQMTNPETDTPVIQVGGNRTPDSDSEYELNVPVLGMKLDEIADKKPKNGLSLALSSDDEDNGNEQNKSGGPMLSLDSDQIANEE